MRYDLKEHQKNRYLLCCVCVRVCVNSTPMRDKWFLFGDVGPRKIEAAVNQNVRICVWLCVCVWVNEKQRFEETPLAILFSTQKPTTAATTTTTIQKTYNWKLIQIAHHTLHYTTLCIIYNNGQLSVSISVMKLKFWLPLLYRSFTCSCVKRPQPIHQKKRAHNNNSL